MSSRWRVFQVVSKAGEAVVVVPEGAGGAVAVAAGGEWAVVGLVVQAAGAFDLEQDGAS